MGTGGPMEAASVRRIYRLAGGIADADVEALGRALSRGEWTVARAGPGLRLRGDGLDVAIRPARPGASGGTHFLVGGRVDAAHLQARTMVEEIAGLLDEIQAAYGLELTDEDDAVESPQALAGAC